jgi:acyl-[acyl-carrier-protein]-phospholipid O-acyltransferase / long-chain-fatty-acid--[acyl-carrier-protein] ligase
MATTSPTASAEPAQTSQEAPQASRVFTYILGRILRILLWTATHTVYRITVLHPENVPQSGGALLIANHMSWVDALLLGSSIRREVRFVMFQDIYDHWFLKPFLKALRVIPISSDLRPREMLRSLRHAGEAVSNGELVCIFAEGEISRIGQMLPFRRGYARIMKAVNAPIIPVHLDGIWGSIFSFDRGRFLWKMPRRFPFPVTVSLGKALASDAAPPTVRSAVQELHTEGYAQHRQWLKPLHRALVRTARRHPFAFAMADPRVRRLRYGGVLIKSIFLARRLRRVWEGQKMVGLLLPPSVPGALVNYAASLLGKVPVNLNYTSSTESIASAAQQCDLKTIITSQMFLEKAKIELPHGPRTVLIEEIFTQPRIAEKLAAIALAFLVPVALLERALGQQEKVGLDDLATIIFSSGSTGEPKGVMLSHFNISANIEQMAQVFPLRRSDKILGILPFFHSFGFTVTLWLPAVVGIGVVFYPNPLDAKMIGTLVRQYAVTFMVATPTFLQTYARRVAPEDFGSLRFVLAGAEKLPERISLLFEDTFGIRPLEGYGATECSPVVAVNVRDFRAAGFRQVGYRRGKIGRPLPGISVKISDPDSRVELPLGDAGLLEVRGPNVMQGYLDRPDRTEEVLHDGWYNTGDLATLDEEGFLAIADRLSRFSKIGGEMVPHLKVEDVLHELSDSKEQRFVVTSLPDEKKGERLVVLHVLDDAQLQKTLARLAEASIPPLWKPRSQQFARVEQLPYLGTGKLDLRKAKEMAKAFSASAAAE